MVEYGKILSGWWVICTVMLQCHKFYMLTPMFFCLLFGKDIVLYHVGFLLTWVGSWNGKLHNTFIVSQQSSIFFSSCLVMTNVCLRNTTIHLFSHDCPIGMRLEWRVGNIYACFYSFDNFWSVIWDCLVYAIVDQLGSLTLVEFLALNGIFTLKWIHFGLKGCILDYWGILIFCFIILLYPIKR